LRSPSAIQPQADAPPAQSPTTKRTQAFTQLRSRLITCVQVPAAESPTTKRTQASSPACQSPRRLPVHFPRLPPLGTSAHQPPPTSPYRGARSPEQSFGSGL